MSTSMGNPPNPEMDPETNPEINPETNPEMDPETELETDLDTSTETLDPSPATTGSDSRPLPAAKRPVSAGLIAVLGVVWSLLLLALAVVCIRDALVLFGAVSGKPWITAVTRNLDGTTATGWVLAIAIGCILLGLLLLLVGLKPRRQHGIELQAETGVLVSRSAVRRVASSAAREVDGVDTASATASRRRVSVDATVLSSSAAADLEGNISRAVEARLSALRTPPTVRVRTTSIGGDQ